MPRYRIAFSREWTLGRWGYLDRFFHDLGGQQSEPSGLDNCWIVEYRGQARHLGRELAKELNIQAVDYRKFGPIFEIEELPGQRPAPRRTGTDPSNRSAGDAAASATGSETASEAPSPSDAGTSSGASKAPGTTQSAPTEPQGPSWVANTDVEDGDIAKTDEGETVTGAFPGSIPGGAGAAMAAAAAAARAQSRWDDLFRIRQRDATGRRRSAAIAEASRRRP